MDSGDRFIKGKWKECIDEIESKTYTVGLLVSGGDLLLLLDGYFKAVLVNAVSKSEL